jgi:hypothetical protein
MPCIDRNFLPVVAVALIARRVLPFLQGHSPQKGFAHSTSMQGDQQRKANTKNDERNQEVNVGKDCADFFEIGHRQPVAMPGKRLAQP